MDAHLFGENDTVETVALRAVMGRFATGLTIVAAIDRDAPVGFTCQSFVSLSLDPPLIAVCPAKSSTSWPRMFGGGRFSVNVLAEDQSSISEVFALSGGDKFAGIDWSPGPFGTPRIGGVVASIECALEEVHDAGDHELVIGRVLSLEASDRAPLLYFRSQFAWLDSSDG